MAKLYFKQEQIQNLVIPNLKDSITNIIPAINYMDSIVIPDSFKYKQQLLAMKNSLYSIKNSLSSEQEHLTLSILKLIKVSDELEKIASILPITDIKLRNKKY